MADAQKHNDKQRNRKLEKVTAKEKAGKHRRKVSKPFKEKNKLRVKLKGDLTWEEEEEEEEGEEEYEEEEEECGGGDGERGEE